MTRPARGTWRAPIVFGVLTAVGLVSALLGDGVWDALSAVTLGVPVSACAWYGFIRPCICCLGRRR